MDANLTYFLASYPMSLLAEFSADAIRRFCSKDETVTLKQFFVNCFIGTLDSIDKRKNHNAVHIMNEIRSDIKKENSRILNIFSHYSQTTLPFEKYCSGAFIDDIAIIIDKELSFHSDKTVIKDILYASLKIYRDGFLQYVDADPILKMAFENSIEEHERNIRCIDSSYYDKHYYIFPHEPMTVTDLIINPNYNIMKFVALDPNPEEEIAGEHILSKCEEIISRQNLLLIIGKYGSGKSLISKAFQRDLAIKGIDTIYVKTKDIIKAGSPKQFESILRNRKIPIRDLYIFIDSLDEANVLGAEYKDYPKQLIETIIRMSEEGLYKFIINSRPFKIFRTEVEWEIALDYYEHRPNTDFELIQLQYYKNSHVSNWLDAFSNEKAKLGIQNRLFLEDIRKTHKHLPEPCRIPLFLYMYSSYYFENQKANVTDLYDIYRSFVERTIRGKFLYEDKKGSIAIQEITQDYNKLLQVIAIDICKDVKGNYDTIICDDIPLDENKISYLISSDKFRDAIEKYIGLKESYSLLDSAARDKVYDNILNCYFFVKYGNYWGFTDNNIGSFLVAQQMITSIIENSDDFRITGIYDRKYFQAFIRYAPIRMHPLTMDLVINAMQGFDRNSEINIERLIAEIIKKENLLEYDKFNEKDVDQKIANLIIIIIYLNIKNKNRAVAKEMLQKAVVYSYQLKGVSKNYFDLARRAFRETDIADETLKDVDLAGFNFKACHFENVRFTNCKIIDTTFNSVTNVNSTFEKCIINNDNFKAIQGEVQCLDCRIQKMIIKDARDIYIRFSNCDISWLEVHDSSLSEIIFDDCRVTNIIFDKDKIKLLDINKGNCVAIKTAGSKINVRTMNIGGAGIKIRCKPNDQKNIIVLNDSNVKIKVDY